MDIEEKERLSRLGDMSLEAMAIRLPGGTAMDVQAVVLDAFNAKQVRGMAEIQRVSDEFGNQHEAACLAAQD